MVNTLRPRKMADISQTTFSNVFSSMKMFEFRFKFHWSFYPEGLINNIPSLVRIMAWRRPGDKPLSEPMVARLPTHICITRPQWVNILSTSYETDLKWVPQSPVEDKLTMVQVMAWYRQGKVHYLSQCWSRSVWQFVSPGKNELNKILADIWIKIILHFSDYLFHDNLDLWKCNDSS